MNEVLDQISITEIRRRKMKNKSFQEIKPKANKVRFNFYIPGTERVFPAGEFNSCMLVIPEVFRIHKNTHLAKESLQSTPFEP
jgi:hypothetical protein